MKCLSPKQSYAELLVSGNWNTNFIGKFLIHASKNIDKERSESLGIDYKMLAQGAIIGFAVLYDVKQYKSKTELELDKNKHYADIKKFGFCKLVFVSCIQTSKFGSIWRPIEFLRGRVSC